MLTGLYVSGDLDARFVSAADFSIRLNGEIFEFRMGLTMSRRASLKGFGQGANNEV